MITNIRHNMIWFFIHACTNTCTIAHSVIAILWAEIVNCAHQDVVIGGGCMSR